MALLEQLGLLPSSYVFVKRKEGQMILEK
jgi:hypothetical protein